MNDQERAFNEAAFHLDGFIENELVRNFRPDLELAKAAHLHADNTGMDYAEAVFDVLNADEDLKRRYMIYSFDVEPMVSNP